MPPFVWRGVDVLQTLLADPFAGEENLHLEDQQVSNHFSDLPGSAEGSEVDEGSEVSEFDQNEDGSAQGESFSGDEPDDSRLPRYTHHGESNKGGGS